MKTNCLNIQFPWFPFLSKHGLLNKLNVQRLKCIIQKQSPGGVL